MVHQETHLPVPKPACERLHHQLKTLSVQSRRSSSSSRAEMLLLPPMRRPWRAYAMPLLPIFFICGLGLTGCATHGSSERLSDLDSNSNVELRTQLRKACIEARGGPHMDAVDVYAGNLSRLCSQWAYKKARSLLPQI